MEAPVETIPSNKMEITISDGRLQVTNLPTHRGYTHDQLIEIIKDSVRKADLTSATDEMLSAFFFGNEVIKSNRANDGVVETPKPVARFIVSLAYRRWRAINKKTSHQPSNLRWLDPCSGAGAFPREIINFYIDRLFAKKISDLPLITITELSPIGITSTLCSIKLALQRNALDFSKYLSSKRLTLLLGDSLSFFPERHDLLTQRREFDIVVGNPPYVRSTRMTGNYKKILAARFPGAFNGSADLYTYFVTSGIASLENHGVLTFISPAAFTRAKSGQALRCWIAKHAVVDTYIDLDETKVFQDAELHAAIYTLARSSPQPLSVHYLHIDNCEELERMCREEVSPRHAIFEQPMGHGWAFHSSEASLQVFSRIFAGCKKLNELNISVYSGIRPGYSKAYIVDRKIYDQFTIKIRSQWFRPVVLPANIKRWAGAKQVHFMLIIPSGTHHVDDELMEYLMPYQDKLSARTEAKEAKEWFALRPCSYYSKMELRKIAFPDLSAQQRFSIVDEGVYVPDGAYFIDTDNLVLLGILNSGLARDYFVKRCSSVGSLSSKGRFRFKKSFVQDFPVPCNFMSKGPLQESISRLVQKMMDDGETEKDRVELDRLIFRLYQEEK